MSGAPLSLEGAERACHRSLRRIVDQHDREQELVPRKHREQDPERRERGPGQRNVDPPEQLPGRRSVDSRRLRQLAGMFRKCARIQNTPNGMYSPISGRMIAQRVFSSPMPRIS